MKRRFLKQEGKKMGENFLKVLPFIFWVGILGMPAGCYGPVELGRDITSRQPSDIPGSGQGGNVPGESVEKRKSLFVTGVE